MRRKLTALLALALCLSNLANAAINFANLEWLISSSTAKIAMKSKGYDFVGDADAVGATDLRFEGEVGTAAATFRLRFTPDNKLVQITVVTEGLTKPAQVYQSLSSSLTKKYGDVSDSQDKRSNQFLDISSQTQLSQGIRLGEVYWWDSWEDESDSLEMETLKGGQIRMDYFSEYWDDEYERREEGKTDDL